MATFLNPIRGKFLTLLFFAGCLTVVFLYPALNPVLSPGRSNSTAGPVVSHPGPGRTVGLYHQFLWVGVETSIRDKMVPTSFPNTGIWEDSIRMSEQPLSPCYSARAVCPSKSILRI